MIILAIYIASLYSINRFISRYCQKKKYLIEEIINILLLILISIIATLLTPQIYLIKWKFSPSYFILFFSLSLILFFVEIKSYSNYLQPNPQREKELIQKIRNTKLSNIGVEILVGSAIPEEIAFRYLLLGLLSAWEPFAALIAVSTFFGISHIFSHSERNIDELIMGILIGFVWGWAYLLTGNIIMIISIHWLVDFITILPIKYPKYANKLLISVFVGAFALLAISYNTLIEAFSMLLSIFSLNSLILGVLATLLLFGFTYLIIKVTGRLH